MTLPVIPPSPGAVQEGHRYPVPCIEFSTPQEPSRPLSRNGWPIRWLPILGPVHSDEGVGQPHVHLDTRFLDVDDPMAITMVIPIDPAQPEWRISTRLLTAVRPEPPRWPKAPIGTLVGQSHEGPVSDGLCPHRGIALACGARLPDGSIQCPGHGLRCRLT